MVKLLRKETLEPLSKVAYAVMHVQEFFTHIRGVNEPTDKPCLYAMWHKNQFCVYGIEQDKSNLNVMVSNSDDGQLIASVIEKMGLSTVRGSSNRKGCVSGTMQMVDRLKEGHCGAIMVDGPRGPIHVVKNGVVKIAKMANVPIVPVAWYCPQFNFVKVPSWDKFTTPVGYCEILNLYGDPIYVDQNNDDENYNQEIKDKIKASLFELESRIADEYKIAKKAGLWKRK